MKTITREQTGEGSLNINTNSFEEKPLYVNAKQFSRILKRREAREKIEAQFLEQKDKKVIHSNCKPYLHESRHNHAMKRKRGIGGRFLTKEELQRQQAEKETNPNREAAE